MKLFFVKYSLVLLSLCILTGVGFAQNTGNTNNSQQDKILIKKQSNTTDDRAAFIKQYRGNKAGSDFINEQDQSSSGARIISNGDVPKRDLSQIRQIESDRKNASTNVHNAISRRYNHSNNNKANQSRNNSGYLYIEQFGKDNIVNQNVKEKSNSYAGQFGDDNQAEVKAKNGKDNNSKILQSENNNRIKIQQQNSGHKAIIGQYKGNNKARISQKGSQNYIDIDQSEGSEMDIKQEGSRNVIKGTRSSWAESLNGSILEIEQYGSNNQADLLQNGSRIELIQKGANNKTTIIQK